MSTVIFRDPRKVKTIELPSFAGSQVEMYDQLLSADLGEVAAMSGLSDNDKGVEIILRLAKSWNFIDEYGAALPITRENLLRLPMNDILALTAVFTEQQTNAEQKKKSSIELRPGSSHEG